MAHESSNKAFDGGGGGGGGGDDPTVPHFAGGSPGERFGKYELVERVGEGGFGVVWKARELGDLQRYVAIKFLRKHLNLPEYLTRFRQEAQLLAEMSHPCIGKVLDSGVTIGGEPYFVMEYIAGVALTAFCDTRQLSIAERLAIFRKVCDGVQYAHDRGIVHRDLKPSNILVGVLGTNAPVKSIDQVVVKVIDFGIAKNLLSSGGGFSIATDSGRGMGSLGYVAPEQARPDVIGVDRRADVYSLGVILYELLTGKTPYTRDQLQAASMRGMYDFLQRVDPPPPSTRILSNESPDSDPSHAARVRKCELDDLVNQLRRELEWIPLKAMARLPDDRYRSPAELSDEVQRYLEGRPLVAGPRTTWYYVRKLARLYRAHVAVAAAILLTLVGGVIATSVQAHLAELARKSEQAAKTRAQQEAYKALLVGINGELASHSFWRARALVDASAQYRGEWEYDVLASLAPSLESRGTPDPVFAMAARDGRIRAVGAFQSFWMSPSDYSQVDRVSKVVARPLAATPDANLVLAHQFAKEPRGWILVDSADNVTPLSGLPSGGKAAGAIADDGSRIALGIVGERPLIVLSRRGDSRVELDTPAAACAFTDDASELIVADATLSRFSATTGQRTGELLAGRQALAARLIKFSPQRDAVIVVDAVQAELWHLSPARRAWSRAGQFVAAAFSPKGDTALLASRSEVHIVEAASGSRSRMLPFEFTIGAVGFTPDRSRAWVSGSFVNRNALVFFDLPDLHPIVAGPSDVRLRGAAASPFLVVESPQQGTADLLDPRAGAVIASVGSLLGPTSFDREGALWGASLAAGQARLFRRTARDEKSEGAPPALTLPTDSEIRVGVAAGEKIVVVAASARTELTVHVRTGGVWTVSGTWPLAPGVPPEQRKPENFVRPALVRIADHDAAVAVAAETGVYLLDSKGVQRSFVPAEAVPEFIEFEPGSTTLAIACESGDVSLTTNGGVTQLQRAEGRPTDIQVRGMFWIEPGKLAVVESAQVVVWDTQAAAELARITIPRVQSAAAVGVERRLLCADPSGAVDAVGPR